MNQGPATCLSHVARDLQLQYMLTVILTVIVSPIYQEQDLLFFSMENLSTGEVQKKHSCEVRTFGSVFTCMKKYV